MASTTIAVRLNAETGQFEQSFKSAQKEVAQFEKTFGNAASSLQGHKQKIDAAFKSFEGESLIKEANAYAAAVAKLGGAAKLTESEQRRVNATVQEAIAKYQALGQVAPSALKELEAATRAVAKPTEDIGAAMTTASAGTAKWQTALKGVSLAAGGLGVALSIGAVKSFITSTLAAAGQIDDLSKKLGVSAEAVQRWKYAAEQGGATIENVEKAVNVMNRSLAEGDSGTIAALDSVGLAFNDIRQMKPEDAFNAITGAIEKIPDPMERARVAMELFGKGGSELLPAIVDGFQKTSAAASVMSDDTVKRLAEAEDNWARFVDRITVLSGELLGFLAKEFSKENPIERFFTDAQKSVSDSFVLLGLDVAKLKTDLEDLKRLKDAVIGKQNETPTAPAAPKSGKVRGVTPVTNSPEALAAIVKQLDRERDALDRSAKSANRHAEALAAVDKKIKELTAGSRALSDAQRTSAERFLALGLSASETALKIGASEIAVSSFQKEQQDLTKILKDGVGSVLGLGDAFKYLGQQMPKDFGILSTAMVSLPKPGQLGLTSLPGIATEAPKLDAAQTAIAKETERLARVAEEAVRNLGSSFSELGGLASGGLGQVLTLMGNLVQSLDRAKIGIQDFKDGFALLKRGVDLSGILSMATGILGIASAAFAAGKAIKEMFFGTAGRDLVKDFAASVGGFDALRGQLNALGAEGEKLWKNLTQGVGRNNPEQALAAIEAIKNGLASIPPPLSQQAGSAGFLTTADLQKQASEAVKLYEYIRDSGLYNAETVQKAWERANAALIASGDATAIAAGKAKTAIDELDGKLKGLYDSIANEAPEEVMGVIEAETRAKIAAIEAERKAAEAAIAQESALRKEATRVEEDAGRLVALELQRQASDVDSHIRELFATPIEVRVNFTTNFPGGGFPGSFNITALASGGVVRRPTLALVGEAGPEAVVPLSQLGSMGRTSAAPIYATFVTPDGEVLARQIVKARKRNGLA